MFEHGSFGRSNSLNFRHTNQQNDNGNDNETLESIQMLLQQ